jgi:hypothetical protein
MSAPFVTRLAMPTPSTAPQTPKTPSPLSAFSFLVVGVVRNCARQIESDRRSLDEALSGAGSVRWLVVESDSSDETLDVLGSIAAREPNFEFVSLGCLRDQHPKRTARIALCRNHYAERIRVDPRYRDVDYVVVADFDEVNGLLTRAAFESCWERQDWDMCAADQDGPYYDIWALRHPDWMPVDCWAQARFFGRFASDEKRVLYAAIHSKMIRIPPESDWIEVESAFGGLAVYKRALFDACEYRGLSSEGEECCEHVHFHALLRSAGARLFINPKLVNTRFTEHSRSAQSSLKSRSRLEVLASRAVLATFRASKAVTAAFLKVLVGEENFSKLKVKLLRKN